LAALFKLVCFDTMSALPLYGFPARRQLYYSARAQNPHKKFDNNKPEGLEYE